MRENLVQGDFVIAAYVVGLGAIIALVAWCWLAMRRAERLRDLGRDEGRKG